MTTSHAQQRTEPTRESLASLILAFLDSDITAFEFDERLDDFRGSDDPVIAYVVAAVWYHYDDCDDHLVCFSKQQWDLFQRLLLLLAADCTIETESRRFWSFRQLIAAASLAVFSYFAVQTGWGYHLLILAVPFGVVSMLIAYTRPAPAVPSDPYHPIIFPFATLSDLERAYRSSGFRKVRYPKPLSERQIRSPFMDAFHRIHSHIMWLLLAPFPLFVQCFPSTSIQSRAKAA